ncbi:hypothetical protein P7L66_13250 [Tistrella mobilis]|uniref:hypothetical protein n=1 Tax=Tistrella mobilis TaxID=171437 RepID=UPI003558D2B9
MISMECMGPIIATLMAGNQADRCHTGRPVGLRRLGGPYSAICPVDSEWTQVIKIGFLDRSERHSAAVTWDLVPGLCSADKMAAAKREEKSTKAVHSD